jgi:activator of 2-hydroxyglutaryl-CoA dehydratase/predicted nucleotide-binding protein (sugar kinase/HSP70/actin superfamily)
MNIAVLNGLCEPPADVHLATGEPPAGLNGAERFIGIDVGAETLKIVEITGCAGHWRWTRRRQREHHKAPGATLLDLLRAWDWTTVRGAAVCGRLSHPFRLPRIPVQQAQSRGHRFLFGDRPATVVSIGSHGFSVLERRGPGHEVFRENSRCSQGTGNFLRQLTGRFSLTVEQASELCAEEPNPAPLSGRCPVILKTDMTHLANQGGRRTRILAGLFDAVCENIMALLKPGLNPPEVYLIGGVSRSRRIQNTFRQTLPKVGMRLVDFPDGEAEFLEALGCALLATERPVPPLPLAQLETVGLAVSLDFVAPLAAALPHVRRLPAKSILPVHPPPIDQLLGFDIGSTGSKLVALDAHSRETVWEGYRRTGGDPVGAAQALLREWTGDRPNGHRVLGFGVTGSGRDIVGSLLTTCYGPDSVFILNEIAAHAEGALHFDARVDTIFEIGGQDAKYIRLAEGRVVDCAMNEACSAGTGSFIEEQGGKFAGIADVRDLAAAALSAPRGVSLGQHCSVFMAEIIDQASAAGADPHAIVAGLYDSVIRNYLHRVKGSRSVGQVIFCQGMPFAADALAAAVAQQTGCEVIIPPNPGTVGALGIALLAHRELPWPANGPPDPLDPRRFLEARLEEKTRFVCQSRTGCGGTGNKCRIDTIRTWVAGRQQRFNWGGGCSLYDRGTRRRKLPNLAPDPFRERESLVQALLAAPIQGSTAHAVTAGPKVAVSDEFMLKGCFPFFARYLRELGCSLVIPPGADHAALKRGVQQANVPWCAPMQLFHGLAAGMAASTADFIFVPRIRSVQRVVDEANSVVCPVVQAAAEVLKWDLRTALAGRLVSPVVELGAGNLESPEFLASCQRIAAALGLANSPWRTAHHHATRVQLEFDAQCREIGRRALAFCAEHDLPPVVVLGRPYTLYNPVLNSNVPALLREQGAIGIPMDCYPVDDARPAFADLYWGHSQRLVRAAQQVRQTGGLYSVFCSNYACGPDSFNLHFYSHLMEGKPFAIIETDGHTGDAGTKTRIEAFLHCVQQERQTRVQPAPARDFAQLQDPGLRLTDFSRRDLFLLPRLGPHTDMVSAALRGLGYRAETLAEPDPESLRAGRRQTSGKECVPMCLTLGTLLRRLETEPDPNQSFAVVMPRTCGPCRFGVYHLLTRLILERAGWRHRIRLWSPRESGYFDHTPPGFGLLVYTGFLAADLLSEALLDVRPDETAPGRADALYDACQQELVRQVETQARGELSLASALWQIAGGNLFGIPRFLRQAARGFASLRAQRRPRPTVLVAGEIYVRTVPFANDHVVRKIEARGCRAQLATCTEWLEYVGYLQARTAAGRTLSRTFTRFLQHHVRERTHRIMAAGLNWPPAAPIGEAIQTAAPYLEDQLEGESVVTLGSALHGFRAGRIDAVISVGPLECMPNKIAESQFIHMAEHERLPSLTLSLNGDPLNIETLDNFLFEVHARFRHGLDRLADTRAVASSGRAWR